MVTKMCYGKLFVHEAFGPSALTHAISLHKETDKKWSRLKQLEQLKPLYNFSEQTSEHFCHMYSKNERMSHISVEFPNEENQVCGIEWNFEWNTNQNKIYGFVTTIPHGIIPNNEQELCENFLKYLHKKWGDICSCEDKRLEGIVSCYVYPLFWPGTDSSNPFTTNSALNSSKNGAEAER